MKKKLLKNMGVLILSVTLIAASGCGDKKTDSAPGTEQAVVTEATETAEPETEATEVAEETETEEPTEAVVPETETEAEQTAEYTVTAMTATKYAKSSVNVRKGPSSDYEKLGGLGTNQKVTVTGQADTGWYRIEYNGEAGFVSDKYLVDEKVAVNTSGSGASGSNAATGTGNAGTAGTSGSAGTDGNSGNASAGMTDTGSAGNTSTGNTGASTPAADASTSTPATDTGSTDTAVDGSGGNPSIDLNTATDADLGLTGFGGLTQGGGENVGVGGDWGHIGE